MRLDGFGRLYNSPLETGIRSVVVLEHLRPVRVDLTEMILFDHVVVHTRDHGGPESLHPPVPERQGELLVRRRLIQHSLQLMQQCHLVGETHDVGGISYHATDEAAAYVELLETPYSVHLKRCSAWIRGEVERYTKDGFKDRLRERIGHWVDAFGVVEGSVRRA